MTTIHLPKCFLLSVKADLVKGRVRITLETPLDSDILAVKPFLAMLALEETPFTLRLDSAQLDLFTNDLLQGIPISQVGQP